jgi:hypothetical protein
VVFAPDAFYKKAVTIDRIDAVLSSKEDYFMTIPGQKPSKNRTYSAGTQYQYLHNTS